jgi:hypothetical protein
LADGTEDHLAENDLFDLRSWHNEGSVLERQFRVFDRQGPRKLVNIAAELQLSAVVGSLNLYLTLVDNRASTVDSVKISFDFSKSLSQDNN